MAWVATDVPVRERFQRIDDFFMKRDPVHETLARVTQRLEDEGIAYAVIGGMALVLHGYVRVTADIDILTTRQGLDAVHERLVGRGYMPAFQGARKVLKDTQNKIKIDFVTEGEYPGAGTPQPVRFPDPATVSVEIEGKRVVTLDKLIELKLASGLSNPSRRLNDLGDVQRLIEALELPLDLAEKLDPSVRPTYIEYWHAHQNATGPDRE